MDKGQGEAIVLWRMFYAGRQICSNTQPGSQACGPPTTHCLRSLGWQRLPGGTLEGTKGQTERPGLISGQYQSLLGLEDLGKAAVPLRLPLAPLLSKRWTQRELPVPSADRLRSGASPSNCCQGTSRPTGRSWWATPAEWAWWSGTPRPPTSSSARATTTRWVCVLTPGAALTKDQAEWLKTTEIYSRMVLKTKS